MKIKRIVRLTAIILTLAMMPLWIFGCGSLDAKVSDRLADLLIPDGKIDKKSESGKIFLEKLDAEAAEINGTVSADGTWPSTTITNEDSVMIAHYKKIFTLTEAWATKGSAYYHKSGVLKNIKNALEYGYENFYGTPIASHSQRKWTETERIDIAEALLNTLLILDNANKLSNKNVKKYAEILEIKIPIPFGNAVHKDRCIYVMIGTAALMGDTDRINEISEKYLQSRFSLVTSGEGLYADGSYVAEGKVSSTGSYGVMAFSSLTKLTYALNGTKEELPDELNAEAFLYNWAINSVIPSIYNGSAIATTTGSYTERADEMGALAVSGILALSKLLDDEQSNELKSIVKAYSSSGNISFVPHLSPYGITAFQDIESNNKLVGKTISGSHPFVAMDKLVVSGSRYSAALSLSSTRSAKFETRPVNLDKNAELLGAANGQGWFSGDGMLLVYNPYYQVSDIYWQYVNHGRLPGTTVDNRARTAYNAGGYAGISSYAGFASHGDFSVAANFMYNNNNEYISDLTAKKSWFIFDDEVVCLGAGISNTSLNPKATELKPQAIETVIENIIYGDNSSIILSADDPGNPNNELVPNSDASILSNNSLYFSKYGGIYVPTFKNDTLKARLSKTAGGNFIELWIDHGITPKNATYEYALLPGATISEFFDYTESIGYAVLSNTEKLQSVKDLSSGAIGYTFWEATETTKTDIEIITGSDFACTVLVKEDESTITVSIADFTHNAKGNTAGGNITLSGARTLVSADTGLTLNGNTITVDRAVAASGQTLTIVLAK